MVELKPASLKLNGLSGVPNPESFQDMMDGLRYRFIDLVTRGNPNSRQWINKADTVVFEMRSPCLSDLAAFAVVAGRLRPSHIDYMYAEGEHCVVYMMRWQ